MIDMKIARRLSQGRPTVHKSTGFVIQQRTRNALRSLSGRLGAHLAKHG